MAKRTENNMLDLVCTLVPVVVAVVASVMSLQRSMRLKTHFNGALELLDGITEIAVGRYENKYGRKPSVLVTNGLAAVEKR